jgi:glycosyltransferase involved in cell wall biosynthesis
MFSVVIPLYNKELSISNTIQSVLNQTFQEFEIVIVNDGSTDNSVKEVEKIDDKRIRLIHQENKGVSAARNRGIKEAKYEWIAFLDGDDLWMENHLEEMTKLIHEYNDCKFFSTSWMNSNLGIKKNKQNDSSLQIKNYFSEMLKRHLVWTGTVVIHNSIVKKVGLFDAKLAVGEDLEYWARIAKQYPLVKSNLVTAIYRLEAENRHDHKPLELNKSIYPHIKLNKNMSDTVYVYYGRMIINKMREFVKYREWSNFFVLLKIHNYKLLIAIYKYMKIK